MTLDKRSLGVTTVLAVLAGLLLSSSALAAPTEIAGVRLEDPIDLRGTPIQLNGAGIRYKAIFKVYVAGLYLGKKGATAQEVYAAPGPKRLSITLLRDIDADTLNKSITEAFENNTPPDEIARFTPGVSKIRQALAEQKKLFAGDNFTIDGIPDTGTILSIKGVQQGDPMKGADLFNALIRAWLGPKPADLNLKDALLGKAS